MSDKEIIRIGPFPSNRQGRIKFIQALLDAGRDGFEIPVESFNTEAKMHFGSRLSIFLHKQTKQETPAPELTEEEKESLVKSQILASEKLGKDDLLWFAQKNSIEVPEDKKHPTAIRKHIKDALEEVAPLSEETDTTEE